MNKSLQKYVAIAITAGVLLSTISYFFEIACRWQQLTKVESNSSTNFAVYLKKNLQIALQREMK